MTADEINASIDLAHDLVRRMAEHELSAGSGCAMLALCYGLWIEQQPDGCREHIEVMMREGIRAAEVAYDRLRRIRVAQQELIALALGATPN